MVFDRTQPSLFGVWCSRLSLEASGLCADGCRSKGDLVLRAGLEDRGYREPFP